jgi:PAS domain S-box-containing protein
MPAKNLYFALYDKEEDILSFPYFIDEYDKPDPPRKLGMGLTEYVLRTGKSLLCTPAVDDDLKNRGEITLVGVPSKIWLGVPLIVGEHVIGVLAVQDYHEVNRFNAEQQRMLEFVSTQIAKAIDQKHNVSMLKRSEQRYQEFVEANPIGHFIAGTDGIIVNCNPAFMNLLGFSKLCDVTAARINITGSTKGVKDSFMKRLQKTTSVKDFEVKLKSATGKTISVLANYSSTLDHNGVLVGIKGIVTPKKSKK